MPFVGELVPITQEFFGDDDEHADPAVVMFQFGFAGKPVTHFYAPTNPQMLEMVLRAGTGEYAFIFSPERAGTYLFAWTGRFTGGFDRYFEGQIVVADRVFAGA
jgi:hypothetical protein